jgi:hypothetical protein
MVQFRRLQGEAPTQAFTSADAGSISVFLPIVHPLTVLVRFCSLWPQPHLLQALHADSCLHGGHFFTLHFLS